jgi:hypothetical protein
MTTSRWHFKHLPIENGININEHKWGKSCILVEKKYRRGLIKQTPYFNSSLMMTDTSLSMPDYGKD